MSANNNNDKFSQSKNESIKSNLFRTHIYVLIINYKQVIAFSHQVLAGMIVCDFPLVQLSQDFQCAQYYVQ